MKIHTTGDGHALPNHGGLETAARTVRHGSYQFQVLHADHAFEVELLRGVDALIIDSATVASVLDIVRTVRSHSDRAIYLKPLFLLNDWANPNPFVEGLTDGRVYSLERLEEVAGITELIMRKDESFTKSHSVSFEDNVLTKLLRYLVSRGRKTLEPIPYRAAKLGYAYPIVDINYQFANEQKTLDVLEVAEQEQLLTGEFVDAWYVCSSCSESSIRLREVCPKCNSPQLAEEELIHHFRCAYIGPVSDFVDEINHDELVCPKCEHRLNHVGVDYDKPSSIFTCHNGHVSQSAPVVARCFTCGSETRAEKLTKRIFKRYHLTPKGEEKALTGVLANVRMLNEIHGSVDFALFQTILGFEIERVRVGASQTSLAALHFTNASELFSFIGREARTTLLAELVRTARDQLRASDVLSFSNFSTLVCLVPSLPPEEAVRRLEQAGRLWGTEIAHRYEGYEAHLATQAALVSDDGTPEEQIDQLVIQALLPTP